MILNFTSGPFTALQAPGPRALGDTTQNPVLPCGRQRSGGHRTARSLLPLGHRAVQVSAHGPEYRGPCALRAAVVNEGADARAGQLAAGTVVVPPGITLYLGLSIGLTG